MPISLKFYRDQLLSTGESSSPLPAAHRLIYLRYGSVIANGEALTQDQFAYHHDPLSLQGEAELSEIWRWELSAPNETPQLLSGTDTLSLPKLARVITTLEAEPGTNWLFLLDSVTSAAGRITPRHRHRGPGIRCLYQGNFNVQGESDSTGTLAPGDAWWNPVRKPWSRGIRADAGDLLRGLLLPTDIKGEMSNIWEGDVSSPKSNWRLFVDQETTI